jgi:putative membrane protein
VNVHAAPKQARSDREPRDDFDPRTIERPDPALMTYYVWVSLLTLLGFPFVLLASYIRYCTLRYKFDDEGVSMSVGLLFKKEVLLTYRRIQDIHVSRNLFERWLGLASIAIQTASGTSGAEMTLVGIREPERLRDYLYTRMRGARGEAGAPSMVGPARPVASDQPHDEALTLLRDIRDGLRELVKERRV